MLTARGEEGDRIRGLSTGADDYIVKPFSVPELLARVRALLRRAKPGHVANAVGAGDIELDRETHRVRRAGHELHLGPTEFRLLEFLMQSPGRVFSREHLLNAVWGHDVYIDERTVDVHVGRLRKAINLPRRRRSHPHGARRRLFLRRDLRPRRPGGLSSMAPSDERAALTPSARPLFGGAQAHARPASGRACDRPPAGRRCGRGGCNRACP